MKSIEISGSLIVSLSLEMDFGGGTSKVHRHLVGPELLKSPTIDTKLPDDF
jgi:hypothetical protein